MKAVVFDMDDTLYPEAEFVRGGLLAAGAWLDREAGLPAGRAAGEFLAVLASDGPFRVFDLGLAALGLPADRGRIAHLVRVFRDHPPTLRLHPGIAALLDDLRGRGLRLGVITDGYEDVQRRKFAALGLAGRVDVALFTACVDGAACPKPGDGAFRAMERALGLAGPDLVYVGDQPAKDFPPAEGRGWGTVRACWPGAWHADQPDPDPERRVARSVDDLRGFLLPP